MENLKEYLYSGHVAVGTFVFYNQPQIVEALGLSGLDFVVIDMEHGAIGIESAMNMSAMGKLRGMSTIIRTSHNDRVAILKAMDAGCDGVQIPLVNTKNDAKFAVSCCKYPPEGIRGVAIPRGVDFGIVDDLIYRYEQANKDNLTIIHCETKECYENLSDILEVDNLDVVFLGPFDMSASLGIIKQFNHPLMVDILENFPKKVLAKGKIPGIYVSTIEEAKLRIEQGYRYIVYGLIEQEVAKLYKNVVTSIK